MTLIVSFFYTDLKKEKSPRVKELPAPVYFKARRLFRIIFTNETNINIKIHRTGTDTKINAASNPLWVQLI
jgi:hypothetical protein